MLAWCTLSFMRWAGITICFFIMSPNAIMAPLGSRSNRPSMICAWELEVCSARLAAVEYRTGARVCSAYVGNLTGPGAADHVPEHASLAAAPPPPGRQTITSCMGACACGATGTHLAVGDLVAALVRGDGAADLGQHVVAVLQSVAGGVAVGHLEQGGDEGRCGLEGGDGMGLGMERYGVWPPRLCSNCTR